VKYFCRIGDREQTFEFRRDGAALVARCDRRELRVELQRHDGGELTLVVDGATHDLLIERDGAQLVVHVAGERIALQVEDERERVAHAIAGHRPAGPRAIEAAMPGVVVDVLVAEGQRVEPGQTLVVLEAMKMQNPIASEDAGVVRRVHARKGQPVAGGAVLVELE
jgi:biotin carboxyl carrier protein